ncbi:hypothetical protein T12_3706 [Trichinella patagoniensis]|uniref:Uncharacterized protein n=1 Tax=Trichinella patagoniensis TaxID=990121 RepID=A0A0V1AG24_9BILA|nr:hypothetical protein T12_15059 [Trichinella patagoniensis]KRY23777.1 hypothetical protein T12_3706 [Trichinella patagoniensis]
MPQGIKKFAYSLRLRLRHFIAQYLPSGKPQALPEAMPQGIKKFAYSLRLRLRHFIAQYLPSGKVMPQAFSQKFD